MDFTKKDTKLIKGIAILLMLMHHLIAFPERYYMGTQFPVWIQVGDMGLARYLAYRANVCVSIFSFLGGYGLYKSYCSPHYFSEKILSVYINFWKVFIIVVPISFLFFSKQEIYSQTEYMCKMYQEFKVDVLISNFIGASVSYNNEWWFLFFFVKSICIGMIFLHLNRKTNDYYIEFAEILLLYFFVRLIDSFGSIDGFGAIATNEILTFFFGDIQFKILFLIGIVFGKYNLLSGVLAWFHDKPVAVRKGLSLLYLVIFACYRVWYWSNMDYILAPLLIVAFHELFGYIKALRMPLEFLGERSGTMYYLHTFLIYYWGKTSKFIYRSNNMLLCYFTFLVITVLLAVLVDSLYKSIGYLSGKFLGSRQKTT